MAFYGIPIILKEGTSVESRETALSENISAIRSISEAIKTTLGPKGLSKMLVDSIGDVTVTNDSFSILDEIEVEHPAAKIITQLAKLMNKNIGDGVTKAIIMLGELLKYGKELLDQKVHPNVILSGYHKASLHCSQILSEISHQISMDEKELKKVAKTALSTKSTFGNAEKMADIATKACLRVVEKRGEKNLVDLDLIQIMKKEGESLANSSFIDGLIVDKEVVNESMPKSVKDAKIALIDHSLEITKTEFDADVRIVDPSQIKAFKQQEDDILHNLIQFIIDSGANVVFCQKGIDDIAQYYLSNNGIMAIRRIKRSDLQKLMKATDGKIITDIKTMTSSDLGQAGSVEEKQIGKDKMIFVENCDNPKSTSILIRGGTRHIAEDAERALKNALSVIKIALEDNYVVPGAGAVEMEVSKRLMKLAKSINTRESIAVEAFSKSIESIPLILAENAGMEPMEILAKLHSKHEQSSGQFYGINLDTKEIYDAFANGVCEPTRVLQQAIKSATEMSMMILRIDEVISASKEGGGPKMPQSPQDDLED
ncbi:MAG: thermosome subunit [Candidatus Lokiarchaeota archaeon]|nr:thermosome subunit [Candidatus Lokiarchaeota archaeon]